MRVTIDSNHIREVLKLSKAESIVIVANSSNVEVVAQELSKTLVVETQVVKDILANIEESGQTTISRRVLELLPLGEVTITDTELISNSRKLTYIKNAEPGSQIPIIQNHILEIPSAEFKQGMSCEYTRSKNESRPILQGVCISKKDFIALDGYTMSVRSSEFEAKEEIVMAPNLVNILKKSKLEGLVDVYADSDYIEVRTTNLSILGRRMSGKYVHYKSLIPQETHTEVIIEAKVLANVLKFYKKAKVEIVTLRVENETLKVSGNSVEAKVEDSIEVKSTNGKEITIHFNIIYLIEALKQYYNLVNLRFVSNIQPLIIEDGNKLELVLPVRITK